MARAFDPAVLFETFRSSKHAMKKPPYPTLRAELDGVRSGKKAITRHSTSAVDLVHGATEELVMPALRRGLAVALHVRTSQRMSFERQPIGVYVCQLGELWRVPALIAFWEQPLMLGWPDGLEAHESTLLGYSRSQRAEWLEQIKWARNSYVYTLLSRDQVARVRKLGQRCFGSSDQVTGMKFFMRLDGPLKKTAVALLPTNLTLARTELDAHLLRVLLGDWTKNRPKARRGLYEVRATTKQARDLAEHMHASVELLTRSGWQ